LGHYIRRMTTYLHPASNGYITELNQRPVELLLRKAMEELSAARRRAEEREAHSRKVRWYEPDGSELQIVFASVKPQRSVAPDEVLGLLDLPLSEFAGGPSLDDSRELHLWKLLRRLSPRQREALLWLCLGHGEKQIARELKLSQHTIHIYIKAIYRAFDVCSRGELFAKFMSPEVMSVLNETPTRQQAITSNPPKQPQLTLCVPFLKQKRPQRQR
jgi:DNA-binding CsgD family transcriptional regulator